MNVAEELEDTELRETKYPRFRVATGGKGPPEPPEEKDNWLSDYECGTTFVSMRINSKDCDFELFTVVFKDIPEKPNVMLLKWFLPDGKIWDKYVEPKTFSKMFKRGVVLGVIRNEVEDGNRSSDWPDNKGGVVLHEAVPRELLGPTEEEEPRL